MSIKIMLDAGHFGKRNRSPVVPEYFESERMWVLCELLEKELSKYGFQVAKTRSLQEKDLAVYSRGKKAKGYDLFISLHSNAVSGNKSADWVDVYYAFDNLNNSRELASALANAIAELMQASKGRVITRKSSGGNTEYYGVLRGARAAGCPFYYIIEHSFHTNEKAARWLMSDENLQRLAAVEAAVIASYYGVELQKTEGDVNGNGRLDSTDLAMIKRALLGSFKLGEEQTAAADINGDGKLTSADYAMAKRKYLGTFET